MSACAARARGRCVARRLRRTSRHAEGRPAARRRRQVLDQIVHNRYTRGVGRPAPDRPEGRAARRVRRLREPVAGDRGAEQREGRRRRRTSRSASATASSSTATPSRSAWASPAGSTSCTRSTSSPRSGKWKWILPSWRFRDYQATSARRTPARRRRRRSPRAARRRARARGAARPAAGTRRPRRRAGTARSPSTPRARNQSQTRSTSFSGADAPLVTPTTSTPSIHALVDLGLVVDQVRRDAARPRDLDEPVRVRRVARADHEQQVDLAEHLLDRPCRFEVA